MAEWIPSIISEKGIYGGRKIPQGSLDAFSDDAGVVGDILLCNSQASSYYYDPHDITWIDSFGLSATELKNRIHLNDPAETNVKCFEIEIVKPESAQYYKQTLAFYLEISGASDTYYEDTPNEYTINRYTWAFTKMSRIEYATPYDTNPTEEIIATGGGSSINVYDILGNIPFDGRTEITDVSYIGLSFMRKNDTNYFCIYSYAYGTAYTYDSELNVVENHYRQFIAWGIDENELGEYFAGFEPEETDDPNEDPDPGGEGGDDGPGGGGEQDKHQDPIDEPDLPPLSATAAGFVTMYKLYEASMQTFAKKMFDPDVWSAIKQLFADPMDFICGILILPFSPHTSRSARPILQQVPPIAWDYYYPVIEQQYHIVDCGTIEVPEYYKTALDYSPYTKDTIYLPYIGYRELNADEVQGKTLKIKYHVDVMTGDCVAFIIRPTVSGMTPMEQVIAQFSGNCGVHVPFGRQSFDNAISASIQLISGIGGLAGGIAMMAGGAGGLASGGKQLAEGMIASSVAGIGVGAVNGSKAHVERSGVMGSSAGYMGVQTPYLIRQIPNQSLPDKGYYRRLNGYPCNQAGKLSDFSGYTAIESIELSGIGATQEEKSEILNMMLGGVIV